MRTIIKAGMMSHWDVSTCWIISYLKHFNQEIRDSWGFLSSMESQLSSNNKD